MQPLTPELEALIESIVDRKLREKFAALAGVSEPVEENLLPAGKAWQRLGFPSYKTFHAAIVDGVFRIGHEVLDRRKPEATRARLIVDVQACRERLKTKLHSRRVV